MPQVLDIEQAVLLLEIEPPFDKRDIQLARRRLAKRWHPDIAPPGRQLEHERHLKAINEAADQLELARRGVARRHGLQERRQGRRPRPRASAAPRRARAPTPRSSASARRTPTSAKHDPFGSRVPDHSVVHRYARCLSYPEWGVGSVNGIYFTGGGDDIQQWARVSFQPGIRTVPAGSLQFVDFSKPDPGAERVERFMTAAKHALAEGDFKLAARRLVYARDAEPGNTAGAAPDDARVLAGGRLQRRRRARCATGSAPSPSAPRRTATPRASTRTWARCRRRSTPPSARSRAAPSDASAWERLGRLRLRALRSRGRARGARARAARPAPTEQGLLDLALVANLLGDVGAEVTRLRAGHACSRRSPPARGRATRTRSPAPTASRDCLEACERALELADDPEVRDLRDQVLGRRASRAQPDRPHRRLAGDRPVHGSPAWGTSTVVVNSTASRASMRRCSRKSGAAHSSSVRPSSPPSMQAKTPRPSGPGSPSTISPPGAIRAARPPTASADQMWPSASSAQPSGANLSSASVCSNESKRRLGLDLPPHAAVGERAVGGDRERGVARRRTSRRRSACRRPG